MSRQSAQAAGSFYCVVAGDPAQLDLLRMMGADGRLSADHLHIRGDQAALALNRHEIQLLRNAGFKVQVGRDLLQQARRVKAQVLQVAATTEADTLQKGFVTQYLDVNGIYSRFASLHAQFPASTQWTDLPYDTLGYDGSQAVLAGPAKVKLFRINTTPAATAKPGLLLVAGTHAREWIPPLIAIEFAEQLLRTYTPGSTVPEVQAVNQIVEGLDILIVPAMNPDGINFSHHDFAMWRKNRHHNPPPASACGPGTYDHHGIDNNRNYSIYWGGAGSSGSVCNDSYRGVAAFSERENQNILQLIEQFPNLLTAVDCHSFGEDIFRAQPTGGLFISSEPVEPRDHAIFLALEAAMNAAISSVSSGKTYSTGTTNNHAGTCDDYLFLAHRIFGFTVECALDFQPPLAQALVVVQEVAAAMRALAAQTLSLASQFTFPVNLVHVIDRSGSMTAFGYAEPTRSNARRVIDLMSLNDSVGVVSFNQAATTHLGLTPISNPGVYATARGAVDGIAFGGFTSIGAGIKAAAVALASAGSPRAIILLSDGYQNRAPWVTDVLPTLPAGVRVNTLALGPQSDQALLQTVASATGGQYYFSPDEIQLHEIYNFIRAEAMEEELALNESVPIPTGEAAGHANRQVIVDEGAAWATFTVSWNDPAAKLRVRLRPPDGPIMDLRRVHRTDGSGYTVLRLRRPQAGVWSIEIERSLGTSPATCTVAAFLRSDLRLRIVQSAKAFIVNKPVGVLAQVIDKGQAVDRFKGTALVSRPAASLASLIAGWKGKLPTVPPAMLKAKDGLPPSVLQALLIRQQVMQQTKLDPLRYLPVHVSMQLPTDPVLSAMGFAAATRRALGLVSSAMDAGPASEAPVATGTSVFSHATTPVAGTYNIRVQVEGRSQFSGRAFLRVGLRSLLVM